MNDETYIKKIHDNYLRINTLLGEEVRLASTHGGVTGHFREEMWEKFFRNIVPRKYSLARGVILIDSEGKRSREVDIAIYDEQYTPYILHYGSLKFIPIEAVVAVVECKSLSPQLEELKKWCQSVRALKANPNGIARVISGVAIGLTNKTQPRTRPLLILVTLKETKNSDFGQSLSGCFDIVIGLKKNDPTSGFSLTILNEDKPLGWWVQELNSFCSIKSEPPVVISCSEKDILQNYSKGKEEGVLKIKKNNIKDRDEYELCNTLEDLRIQGNDILSLTFQLNQLLMLINNPMMFPHLAYAKIFNKIISQQSPA